MLPPNLCVAEQYSRDIHEAKVILVGVFDAT